MHDGSTPRPIPKPIDIFETETTTTTSTTTTRRNTKQLNSNNNNPSSASNALAKSNLEQFNEEDEDEEEEDDEDVQDGEKNNKIVHTKPVSTIIPKKIAPPVLITPSKESSNQNRTTVTPNLMGPDGRRVQLKPNAAASTVSTATLPIIEMKDEDKLDLDHSSISALGKIL